MCHPPGGFQPRPLHSGQAMQRAPLKLLECAQLPLPNLSPELCFSSQARNHFAFLPPQRHRTPCAVPRHQGALLLAFHLPRCRLQRWGPVRVSQGLGTLRISGSQILQ